MCKNKSCPTSEKLGFMVLVMENVINKVYCVLSAIATARNRKDNEYKIFFFYAGTGTFGRVHLVKEKSAKNYFALKVMSIPDVIRLKQEQHVHNEKSVLKEVNHPFLVRL